MSVSRQSLSKNSHPIWIHAASGEYEYAKSIVRKIKSSSPNSKILVTFFSPSYAKQILSDPLVDFAEPLPLDLPGPVSDFLNHYQPKMLIISRTDLWPEVLNQCQKRKIPSALTSAKRPSLSVTNRFILPLRAFLFGLVDEIYACDQESANYFTQLLPQKKILVLGDTQYDQVFYRINHPVTIKREIFRSESCPILCVGSSWPEDEKVLFKGLLPFLKNQKIKVILAPHEPSATHLDSLSRLFQSLQLKYEFYSQCSTWNSQILIIDQVGILANLYEFAQFSFIGGSFKKKVHSVKEPLAVGHITLVGPYFNNSPEAVEFSKYSTQGFNAITVVKTDAELTSVVERLLQSNVFTSAKSEIQNQMLTKCGATNRIYSEISKWIQPRGSI